MGGELLEEIRANKRRLPFDGIVRRFVQEHPTKSGVLRASEAAKKIFEALKSIEPGDYRKQDDATRKALEHLDLFQSYASTMGLRHWREYSWDELAASARSKASERPERKLHHHFTSLVTHALERYAWPAGAPIKRLGHSKFKFNQARRMP